MGYTTKFTGCLKFAEPISVEQLAQLESMLDEDVRDHPEWQKQGEDEYTTYIDLALVKGEDGPVGLEWNGAEKTYGMVNAVNIITRVMRQKWPTFRLTGELLARGEDFSDNWTLRMNDDGIAHKAITPVVKR